MPGQTQQWGTFDNDALVATDAAGSTLRGLSGDDVLTGGLGNDLLLGGEGADVLIAAQGDDQMDGGSGDDVYRFATGSGMDRIVRRTSSQDVSVDTIELSFERTARTVSFTRSGQDLVIGFDAGVDVITIDGYFDAYAHGIKLVDRMQWLDAAVDLDQIPEVLALIRQAPLTADDDGIRRGIDLYGHAYAPVEVPVLVDALTSSTNSTLAAGAGHDFLLGGDGSDALDGGLGRDILVGDLTAIDHVLNPPALLDHDDTLQGGDGNDMLQGSIGDDVLIGGRGNDGLFGDFINDPPTSYGFQGDDILDGCLGDDYLNDRWGQNTFVFDRGYGHDRIVSAPSSGPIDPNGIGFVAFGAGLSPSSMVLNALDDGALSIRFQGLNDQLTIHDFFTRNVSYQITGRSTTTINGVRFADGTTLSSDQLYAQVMAFAGSPDPDNVLGDPLGNVLQGGGGQDLVWGFDGDDDLAGGGGYDILTGGLGGDTYRVMLADGYDQIDERGHASGDASTDRVVFGPLLTPAMMHWERVQENLRIQVTGTSDVLEITGIFSIEQNAWIAGVLEQFRFDDGTSFDLPGLLAAVPQGTVVMPTYQTHGDASSETLVGSSDGEHIFGGGGNDYIAGRAGADRLEGGDGDDQLRGEQQNDVLIGGQGDDTLVGGLGHDELLGGSGSDLYRWAKYDGSDYINDASGHDQPNEYLAAQNDILQIIDLNSTDVVLRRRADDLLIESLVSTEVITITGQFNLNAPAHQLELVMFADGVMLDAAALAQRVRIATADDDDLVGQTDADVIQGLAGDDTLRGLAGDDTLIGAQGSDVLRGGDGADDLQGGGNRDYLYGEADSDRLDGSSGDDFLYGGAGDDLLDGGLGGDIMDGGAGSDTYTINRWYTTGAYPYLPPDRVVESTSESGFDLVRSWVSIGHNYDGIEAIELLGDEDLNAGGNATNEILTGNSGGNQLSGLAGDDTLRGMAGDDLLVGGLGQDVLDGGLGDDVYRFAAGDGNDLIIDAVATGGNDRIELVAVSNGQVGLSRVGDDLLIQWAAPASPAPDGAVAAAGSPQQIRVQRQFANGGEQAIESLVFGDGSSMSRQQIEGAVAASFDPNMGSDGDDMLHGTASADTMTGLGGNDGYTYNDAGDNAVEQPDAGFDTVYAQITATLPAQLEALRLMGSADLAGSGNALANQIYGNDGSNWLSGEDGNDTIRGGAGNDDVRGGNGGDLLYGEDGDDLIDGGAGADLMNGGAGDDRYTVSEAGDVIEEVADGGIDTVLAQGDYVLYANLENLELLSGAVNGSGNSGSNWLVGNAASNWLGGGAGGDTIFGRDGNDALHGDDGNDVLHGEAGDDLLDGGAGDNQLIGGAGNDRYMIRSLGDLILEDTDGGIDTAEVYVDNYVPFANVENVTLAAGVLSASGSSADNWMEGNAGDNFLGGGLGHDALFGFAGNDYLKGDDGDDRLEGGAGDDILEGNFGVDTLMGGDGNDTYYVDGPGDVIVETASGGIDTVYSSGFYTLSGNLENLVIIGEQAVDGTGDAGSNWMRGNAHANGLNGGAGDDMILGGGGADTLRGGQGNDMLDGQDGGDSYVYQLGDGQDQISDDDATAGVIDTLDLSGIARSLLAFARNGDNLVVNVNDPAQPGSVTVLNWFAGERYQLESIVDADGARAAAVISALVGAAPVGPVPASPQINLPMQPLWGVSL